MTPRLVPYAPREGLSPEISSQSAWWQDVLLTPTRRDLAKPAFADAEARGGFVHEKWWLEEIAERTTG